MTPIQLLTIDDPRLERPDADVPAMRVDSSPIVIRTADVREAGAIHSLIVRYLAEGHLLPRGLEEIALHAHRFVVAAREDEIVACAELAPLSRGIAEVRSMVVSRDARGAGIGRRLVDELLQRASTAGFEKLCAFTHSPAYFVRLGFSIVPHAWLPAKIATDCHSCRHFRNCGQYAVVRFLEQPRTTCVPLAALHG